MVKSLQTIFVKCSILDVWQGSENVFGLTFGTELLNMVNQLKYKMMPVCSYHVTYAF